MVAQMPRPQFLHLHLKREENISPRKTNITRHKCSSHIPLEMHHLTLMSFFVLIHILKKTYLLIWPCKYQSLRIEPCKILNAKYSLHFVWCMNNKVRKKERKTGHLICFIIENLKSISGDEQFPEGCHHSCHLLISQPVYCSDVWEDLPIGLGVRVQVKLIRGRFAAVSWGFGVSRSQRTVTIMFVPNCSFVLQKNAQTPAARTFFKGPMKLIGKGASKPWQSRLLFLKWGAA